MTKIRFHIYILLLFCSFNFTAHSSNFLEEENFVTSFADSAISILSNDTISDAERTSSFTELVMSSIDLNLISKFVLSKAWKNASDEQKENYLIAFKDYFVSSYANKLDQYTGERVDVIGSQEAGKYVIVESNIVREGTDTLKINLKWRLLNKNNQIKIIDLNIEGISLVIAQREEFQSFLANNDYDLDKLIEKIVSVSD
ncbi:ABC transporter substrate-binding protein [Pelagibacterales bacterium SAG-MED32]|jgi:phospholipid transport system substrate-binding protein|nr:ABC transporter substrate-binding protein [Pelagibacterales bacterium SAG-MED32]|tara:strand:- start:280 stop:879 length:600 start_codon:yes stop_codon:yes gene_type:complete